MSWHVYMLRCCDGSLYTGYTDDVERRLSVHQRGKGAKYTRSRLPVELAYCEELPDKSAALRREVAIKRLTRQQKLLLVQEYIEERRKRELHK
jgi:predicted GIY-YIG superfamily endonuclease